ncbi:unnamed protein product [Prorocentrum cordatum]|uniref:ATP synthase F1 complex delta/epsilon subunit N-terminal domain-containing protein n=1 Tax=Prorocentrum cordatum TaxID=2364126 RepID=A0ABN9W2Q0_9DINO|nr:unnamed protein product [Polarella glacialis]
MELTLTAPSGQDDAAGSTNHTGLSKSAAPANMDRSPARHACSSLKILWQEFLGPKALMEERARTPTPPSPRGEADRAVMTFIKEWRISGAVTPTVARLRLHSASVMERPLGVPAAAPPSALARRPSGWLALAPGWACPSGPPPTLLRLRCDLSSELGLPGFAVVAGLAAAVRGGPEAPPPGAPARDARGNTPLHQAAYGGHAGACRALLERAGSRLSTASGVEDTAACRLAVVAAAALLARHLAAFVGPAARPAGALRGPVARAAEGGGAVATVDRIKMKLQSPEGEGIDLAVSEVVLPSASGQLGVLANHAPMMTALDTGVIRYKQDGKWMPLVVMGGFASVDSNSLSILVNDFETVDKIDAEAAKKAMEEATAKLEKAESKKDKLDATGEVKKAAARLQASMFDKKK